jgi:hypothetical protein
MLVEGMPVRRMRVAPMLVARCLARKMYVPLKRVVEMFA